MLERRTDDARANGLGEHEQVTETGTGVRDQRIRMHRADHGHAELGLGIVNRVPTDNECAGLPDRVGPAALNLRQHVKRQRAAGERGEVQGKQRRRTHCVDIAKRVRRRDRPKVVGVIDDGCEDVDGCHEGEVLAQPVDGSIIQGGRAHEQVVGHHRRHLAHHMRQLGGAELAGSAGAV